MLNKNYRNNKILFLGVILILILITVGIFLLNSSSLKEIINKTKVDVPISYTNTLIPIENPKMIKMQNTIIKLSGSWNIIKIKKADRADDLKCEDSVANDCLIYFINNSKNTFYISNNPLVKIKDNVIIKKEDSQIKVINNNINLTLEKYILSKRTQMPGGDKIEEVNNVNLYREGYVIIDVNIYASTGLLSSNLETNLIQVKDFKDLLNNLAKN